LLTLVLMPFLLYPLLSVVFRKFMFTGVPGGGPPTYAVACDSPDEADLMQSLLLSGRPLVEKRLKGETIPQLTFWVAQNAQDALLAGEVDLVVQVTRFPPNEPQMGQSWEVDCELITIQGSVAGERASRHIEDCFRAVGAGVVAAKLRELGVPQRATPVRTVRIALQDEGKNAIVSLSALIPFVLILMTITGAVYPAIDLTAGERERGTLELLIAAPVPRLGLLFAKYVAVLAVAMLTATINIVAMTATISFSGLGPMVWGEKGLSWMTVAAVFGLLFLLASFFSAVLLTITSFARSFKEAQAYLIPLMLFALGPGLISLMPGVELEGWLVVTPLLNVAILSRDILAGEGSMLSALVVVISTAFYSFAALGIAAKLFAADTVLYDARLGWGDLWRRPKHTGTSSVAQALLCLACMFPISFAALGGINNLRDTSLAVKFALMSLATAVVYGGVPLLFAYWRRVSWRNGLSIRAPTVSSLVGAALLGLSLWPFAHEIVVIARDLGFASVEQQHLDKAQALIEQARRTPLWLFLTAIALAPAVFEEFCFRGFVFGAFRTRWSSWRAILVTGIVFGLFHLVTSDALAVERLLPSTALGCILGWVCWRSSSLFPSMVLHGTHNGLLGLAIYYLPELRSRGWGIEERSHLPASWLVAAGVGVLVGWSCIHFGARRREPNPVEPLAAEAPAG
jgi:sodium transport system permease protein